MYFHSEKGTKVSKMQTLKSKIQKIAKKEYLVYIFFIFAIFSILVLKPIENLDEIWNYNTARALLSGLIPYKEISMITTPFLPIINSIFLFIFGNEVIVDRIFSAIINAGILYLTFNILRKTFEETNISLISTFLLYLLYKNYFCLDYNFFVLLLVLIMINIEINFTNKESKDESTENTKRYSILNDLKQNKKINICIGVIAGLAICTKQSVGAVVAVFSVIYPLIWVRNKPMIKNALKCSIYRIIGILIPILILFIYLLVNGAIGDFIDYAIKGISHFKNSISYERLYTDSNFIIKLLARSLIAVILIIIISAIFIKKSKRENRNLLPLIIYAIPMLILLYPISDVIHFIIATYVIWLTGIYLIFGVFGKWLYSKVNLKRKKRLYKITSLIIFLLLFVNVTTNTITNYIDYYNQEKTHNIKHYSGIQIEDYLLQRINEIDSYIKEQVENGKKVYILDAEAAVYNIPLDIYNKDYDMFLKGNIGKDGEEGLIKKVEEQSKDDNNLFLIRNDNFSQNWQTPLEVVNYVKDNFNKIDEISIYDVYKK